MMKTAFRSFVGISAVALVLSAVTLAKGDTTKIRISGGHLAYPIEITDATIVKEFQVWTGPGTTGCLDGRSSCVAGAEGFIVDWSSGAVRQKPNGLPDYEVSFYVTDARVPSQTEPDHLAYVVSYQYDPAAAQGYVYVPGKGDQWFALNVGSIYRRLEGQWFRATRAWQDAVVPLITRR